MSEQFRDLVGLGEECEQRMLCHPQSHCVVRIRELFPNIDNKEVQLYMLQPDTQPDPLRSWSAGFEASCPLRSRLTELTTVCSTPARFEAGQ